MSRKKGAGSSFEALENLPLSKRKKKSKALAEAFEFEEDETFVDAVFIPNPDESDLKKYIVESTNANGLDLSLGEFEVFLGIIIFSTFNQRQSQKDYWSLDPFLRAEPVAAAMSRNRFEAIKSKIKFHKPKESDNQNFDKVWRVRPILNIFRKNIMKFGFYSTALSIDEMMVKYFGRCKLKQFIRTKPTRFGIKLWASCSSSGYLYDCDIYCGKNLEKGDVLANCALGSRVVVQMLQQLLSNIPPTKLLQYHVYFDNLFCCPDLLVHLKKIGLRATGTVRSNRIKEKNNIKDDAPRGTYAVKNDKHSGINFITLKDSKLVSVLSTAAGVRPLTSVKRYNKEVKRKTEVPFPNAFSAYNKFMGGVDIHDQYCNRVMPIMRSKKWTWVIFIRLIQSAITKAVILSNDANEETIYLQVVRIGQHPSKIGG
ncbi:piggyBac transposable element-derived protein 3-like [Leptopilina boulardi]|uniref:piggyBac transposable element-derived protein 3-like n=1 Tax=Leptopilina boulardi TaxID=63433 RepID=UPI0021F66833|nr:piggyBac transposable element-derived protein 3-like [Leptopilina boulardi]